MRYKDDWPEARQRLCALWAGEMLDRPCMAVMAPREPAAGAARSADEDVPADVRRELAWLVEQGPPIGLILGASSSVCPGVKRENVDALIEGLKYYRQHGRG